VAHCVLLCAVLQGGCPVSVLLLQYRMHPAIRAFPSGYFYKDELIDADSILIRPKSWYLDTPAAVAEAPAAGTSAAGAAASILSPADPRLQRRSPTPEQAAAAAAGARAADGGGSGSSGSSSLLLPYALFNVSGVEHSVGRSKANTAEADLAVELYCQLRPALLVRSVAAAAEAAARGELLLALPTDVSGVAVGLCIQCNGNSVVSIEGSRGCQSCGVQAEVAPGCGSRSRLLACGAAAGVGSSIGSALQARAETVSAPATPLFTPPMPGSCPHPLMSYRWAS
jgi:hypothetical protein